MMMLVAALFGGPFASTCYVVGLQMAGSIVVPISALCPAIGAILARFLFRQPLTPRMMLGILICLSASALIGFSSMGGIEARPHMMLGLFFGFLAALGWGIEGCVCGYGVSIIDSASPTSSSWCPSWAGSARRTALPCWARPLPTWIP